jgi:hypothetical protein
MINIFRSISLQVGRFLLSMAVDRALRNELPMIFARLDLELPFMLINNAKPLTVQAAVTDIIEEKLTRTATATQVSAVLALYDPVKAALKNVINR